MHSDVKKAVVWVGSFVFTGLLSGNIFFVKRLVDEMDAMKRSVNELQRQVAVIDDRFDARNKRKWDDAAKDFYRFKLPTFYKGE